jgi:uncharacterized protein YukE
MNEKLQETLRELHSQLSQLDGLDDAERKQLEAAAQEIQDSLGRTEVKSAELAEGFQNAIEKFSESHPQLTQAAGQVAQLLSQMGI